MSKNFFRVAFKNLLKHKSSSIINILGLAIGISCSILFMLYVYYEINYDTYHEKSNRIYRVAVKASIGDTKINQTYSSAITYLKLLEEFPEIETGVKFFNIGEVPIITGEKTFYESRIFAVDSTFYDVFSIGLLKGNANEVLVRPNTMVVTQSTALKYFGTTSAIGNVLQVDFGDWFGLVDFEISGVSEDVPEQSHFHYDFLISLSSFPDLINNTGWTSNNFITYLVLKEGASKAGFDEKLPDFTRKYMGVDQFDEWVANGNFWEYFLQPIQDIHLDSDLNGEFEPNGNRTYVYIFSIISIIILFIACVNFMNLSTAKSSLRAKEVGLKKVVGSGRFRLIQQFLSESVFLSFIALALSILILELVLPYYSDFVGKPIEIHYFDNPLVIPSLIALALLVGLISGSYPAFFLSSFKPVLVLKGNVGDNKGGVWLRNLLVVFQFAITVVLIIGTITIFRQLNYFQNKKLGFDKEQVLVIKNPGSLHGNTPSYKEKLKEHNNVVSVTGSNTLPGRSFSNIGFGAEGEENFTLNLCICDYDFLNTLKLNLNEGRFFSKEFPSDSAAVVINQKTVDLLGWEDPIGRKINNWSSERGDFHIIGVIEDYHYESLHQEVRPMALFLTDGYYKREESFISVKLNTNSISETLQYAENAWGIFAPGTPFKYSFLNKDYEDLYMNEKQTRKLFTIFTVLAIFIACLGLYGLAAFVADQRTKEIGIRKVMGASVFKVVKTLNLNFSLWILIANIIAWPAAWYIMNLWLQNFAYRVNIPWWSFVIASGLSMLIAYAVISTQTARAALRNPAETLKHE